MLKLFRIMVSILLIGIIVLRIPQENRGLAGFASSAERSLNILTTLGVLIYFIIAVYENILSKF